MDSYFKEHVDFVTLSIVLALTGIGVASVYSATYDAGASAFFQRQLIWGGIGFLLMISILVSAHEYGHYLLARAFGMGVEEFAIGFGKKPLRLGEISGPPVFAFTAIRDDAWHVMCCRC